MCNDPIYSGKNLWEDPHKDGPSGLLLSDRISYYAQKCKMIDPFEKKDLRSAYYTLHIGDEYWTGREKHNIPDGGSVKIEPNGFVYIRVKEFLNVPFYIVARYSLCVTLVYRGLMLDNGLQIDPGFRGNIHIPIYNFTDDIKYLKRDDPLLSIEFVKTSFSLNSSDLAKIDNPDKLYGSTFEGVEGHPLKMFKKIRNRSLLEYFKPEDKNQSSVLALKGRVGTSIDDMTENIEKYKKDTLRKVDTTKLIGGLSLLGVIIGLFAIILVHFYWQESKFSTLNSKYENIINELSEKIWALVEKESSKQTDLIKGKISAVNTSLEEMNNRIDVSQEMIKTTQEKMLKLKETQGVSDKNFGISESQVIAPGVPSINSKNTQVAK